MAYVQQDDVHLPMLTVQETLEFASYFRMEFSTTPAERKDRVKSILETLKLEAVAKRPVATLPGGQKRRLSIGVDIINYPTMIFLDEPTTGLDSASAEEVVLALKNLSRQNRLVMCSIHQPSVTVFMAFDNLILLSEGHLIFSGRTGEVRNFYVTSPYKFLFRSNENPANYIMDIASASAATENAKTDCNGNVIKPAELAEYFNSYTQNQVDNMEMRPSAAVMRETDLGAEDALVDDKKYMIPLWYQFYRLLHRYSLRYWRMILGVKISIAR